MNVGEYKIRYELSSDAVFKWYEAVEQYGNNNKVILQILQPGFSAKAIDAIFDYLESLQTLRRKTIWVPIQMFSSAEYPLVAIYPHINVTKLTQILPQEPRDALSFWQQISETLHILNNKGLVYGHLNINHSIGVVNKAIYLGGFGYTPLLKLGDKKTLKALEKCKENIAPEVFQKNHLSPAADIYSFAKTIVSWHSQLSKTRWYFKATDPDPNQRYRKIRDTYAALEEAIDILDILISTDEKRPKYNSVFDEFVIIPTRYLKVEINPPEAGKVIGGNKPLAENSKANITAKPSTGWYFTDWSGDFKGNNNSATILMDTDKTIVANFEELVEDKFQQDKKKIREAKLWLQNGFTRGKSGNYQEAIEAFDRAIALEANNAEAFYNRGLARAGLNKYQWAIEDYNQALRLAPRHVQAYSNRGIAYRKLGEYEKAIADFDCALKINPNDSLSIKNKKLSLSELNNQKKQRKNILNEKTSTQNWECTKTLVSHTTCVRSIAISSDRQILVSGSDDGTIKLWELNSGKLIKTITWKRAFGESDGSCVNSVAISPDGKTIISGHLSKFIKIWNLDNGKLIRNLRKHSDSVTAIAISPNGKIFASASRDKTVKTWNLLNKSLLHTYVGHTDLISTVAITPDGRTLASGSRDSKVKIWDLSTRKLLQTINGHSDWVRSIAFSPDSKILASGSADKTIRIWSPNIFQETRALYGHTDWVNSVAITPDGKTLVSGGRDTTIKLWQIDSGRLICNLTKHKHSKPVCCVAISSDGRTIASSSEDGKIKIWQQI